MTNRDAILDTLAIVGFCLMLAMLCTVVLYWPSPPEYRCPIGGECYCCSKCRCDDRMKE